MRHEMSISFADLGVSKFLKHRISLGKFLLELNNKNIRNFFTSSLKIKLPQFELGLTQQQQNLPVVTSPHLPWISWLFLFE